MQTKSLTKVGYLVHLSSEKDDSIDLDLKRRVLEVLLEETTGLRATNSLSYKNNPLVAQLFIKDLKKDGIDTIVVHDSLIFDKEVIGLFVVEGFRFVLVEVNGVKSKYRVTAISNDDLRHGHQRNKISASKWINLKSKYSKALFRNEKTAKWLNGIIDEMEKKTM
ncbi:hypothetical protein [Oceanobacillus salinisoli]|uniref:hypothetical protein n=1 Tax=Oceanobacillus salinisoli TaxID=2678611 RepID=UPI0012E2C212|nr:hypothetical protein [Oceanobacillus salinisoli]